MESWKRFLAESLSGNVRANLAQHLDTCARCQATVDRLCKGSATWLEVAKRWRQGPPGPSPATPDNRTDKSEKPSVLNPVPHQGRPAMIAYACPRCSTILRAQQDQAGSKHDCPSCGQRLQVPLQVKKTVLGEQVPEEQMSWRRGAEPKQPQLSRSPTAEKPAQKWGWKIVSTIACILILAAGVGKIAQAIRELWIVPLHTDRNTPVIVTPLLAPAKHVTNADFVGTWFGKCAIALADSVSCTVEGDTTYNADGSSLSLSTFTIVSKGPNGFTLHLVQTETGKWHIEEGMLTETTETRIRKGATADDMNLIKDNPFCAMLAAKEVDHEPEMSVISNWKGDSCTVTSVEVIEGLGRVSVDLRRKSK